MAAMVDATLPWLALLAFGLAVIWTIASRPGRPGTPSQN
jgi:hypothetical protein